MPASSQYTNILRQSTCKFSWHLVKKYQCCLQYTVTHIFRSLVTTSSKWKFHFLRNRFEFRVVLFFNYHFDLNCDRTARYSELVFMILITVGRDSESCTFISTMRWRAGGRRLNRGSAYGNSPIRYASVVDHAISPTDLPTVRFAFSPCIVLCTLPTLISVLILC